MTQHNDSCIRDMTILIIDDSKSNIQLLRAILNQEGFKQIFTASSLNEAKQILEERSVDLVLVPYVLTDISGLEIVSTISDDLRYQDIPIIVITANIGIEVLRDSFAAGASDFISKPINAIELTARVHAHLIRKQIADERKKVAITDPLTGLYNRRYFDTIFNELYEKSLLEEKSLAFFMIDIDNFKKYNDNYGHDKGDEALRNVADVLDYSLKRTSDYLFRIGGEEFVILLHDYSEEHIEQLSKSIHEHLRSVAIEHKYNENYGIITLSMGIALYNPKKSHSKFEIYKAADKALYEAKESGRNKSVITTL